MATKLQQRRGVGAAVLHEEEHHHHHHPPPQQQDTDTYEDTDGLSDYGDDSDSEASSLFLSRMEPLYLEFPVRQEKSFDQHDDNDNYSYGDLKKHRVASPSIWSRFWISAILLLAFLAFVLPAADRTTATTTNARTGILLDLMCPSSNLEGSAPNFDAEHYRQNYYEDGIQKQMKSNLTLFLQTYQGTTFDAWGLTYDEVKQGQRAWKEKRFLPNLQSGDSVFESACGIGLNLMMTLEILHDAGLDGIIVYGNEFVQESADLANQLLSILSPSRRAINGGICAADSSRLDYIPDSAFDLVFTGYITPDLDPLDFGLGDEANFERLHSLCESDADDWKAQKLNQLAQERQEDWYGKWVGEMIRIAKPGKAVIVEQVSRPACETRFDWGGVSQSFWQRAVDRYGWDVDPNSIEFEVDPIFNRRYNVFMRKI